MIVESPVLEDIEPHLTTGKITIPEGGASITLPDHAAYVPWQELQRILILTPSGLPDEADPLGVIISDEQFDILMRERQRAHSREAWEMRSNTFLAYDGVIEVHWLDGWIDTTLPLPSADELLSDMQLQSQVINHRRLMGPLCISFDGWGEKPVFDAKKGTMSWSMHTSIQAQQLRSTGMPGATFQAFHHCQLGARGVLRLICNETVGMQGFVHDVPTKERIRRIAQNIAWDDKAHAFTARQPADVGERTGGLRHVIQPRLLLGHKTDDLVFRRGLGYAWILILIPAAAIIFLVIRWLKGTMQAMTPSQPTTLPGADPRCPACGSLIQANATRCLACGASLIQR